MIGRFSNPCQERSDGTKIMAAPGLKDKIPPHNEEAEVATLGADAWACSGHKGLLGPQGVGVLYLTIFAAFRLYSLLPPGPAFVLLIAVAFFSAALAVLQDSLALAAFGRRWRSKGPT